MGHPGVWLLVWPVGTVGLGATQLLHWRTAVGGRAKLCGRALLRVEAFGAERPMVSAPQGLRRTLHSHSASSMDLPAPVSGR